MKKYYNKINAAGKTEMLLTYDFEPVLNDSTIVEITKEEYDELMAKITAEPDPEPTDEISDSEALAIILGGDSA